MTREAWSDKRGDDSQKRRIDNVGGVTREAWNDNWRQEVTRASKRDKKVDFYGTRGAGVTKENFSWTRLPRVQLSFEVCFAYNLCSINNIYFKYQSCISYSMYVQS